MAVLLKTRMLCSFARCELGEARFHASGRDAGVRIAEPMWEDMGSPQAITVTIEPGDLLNVEAEED